MNYSGILLFLLSNPTGVFSILDCWWLTDFKFLHSDWYSRWYCSLIVVWRELPCWLESLLLILSLLVGSWEFDLFSDWLVWDEANAVDSSTIAFVGSRLACSCLQIQRYLHVVTSGVWITYDLGEWCLYNTFAGSNFLLRYTMTACYFEGMVILCDSVVILLFFFLFSFL